MDADTHGFKFCFYPCSSAFIRGLFFVRFSIEKLHTSDKRCLKAVIVAFCSAKVAFFNRGSNLALAIADFFETTDGRGYTRIQVLFLSVFICVYPWLILRQVFIRQRPNPPILNNRRETSLRLRSIQTAP